MWLHLCVTLSQGVGVGDLVVEFGSVNVDNFKNIQDIGSLVQHSQGVSHHHRNYIVYIIMPSVSNQSCGR